MIAGRVGDGVDRFDAGFTPRQWQYRLHGYNRRLMSLLIGGTSLTHLTVGGVSHPLSPPSAFSRKVYSTERTAEIE